MPRSEVKILLLASAALLIGQQKARARLNTERAHRQNEERDNPQGSAHFFAPQSQLLPQLHSLPSFMGQFLPVFLQFGFSAAKAEVQIIAAKIDIRTLIDVVMPLIFSALAFLASKFSACND